MSYTTVIVGTDGSESALRAVQRGAELAASSNALLVIVCAYSPVTARAGAVISQQLADTRFDPVRGTDAAEDALRLSATAAARAGASGVDAVLVEGDPTDALLSAANERGADLIVVGNRGINTLPGRVLGSIAVAVSQRASCDVLIVHTTGGGL
jgi:nucleotide-binding universal stress UspA family protein